MDLNDIKYELEKIWEELHKKQDRIPVWHVIGAMMVAVGLFVGGIYYSNDKYSALADRVYESKEEIGVLGSKIDTLTSVVERNQTGEYLQLQINEIKRDLRDLKDNK